MAQQKRKQRICGVEALKRHDIKTSTIVFLIYCFVCSGAFGIEEMIPSGPGITMVLLLVFPIIWAWPLSNIMAEAGALIPKEGGIYIWVKEAFGEFWGFQAGWWNTASVHVTNGVYVALVVDYASQYIEMSKTTAFALKIIMILLFTIVNLLGLKQVGSVSTALSLMILAGFMAVSVVGLLNWRFSPIEPFLAEDIGILEGVGGTAAICAWMYCGYESISVVAGEVKKPQLIPKALMLCMPLVMLSYVLPTAAGLVSVGEYENWATFSGDGTVGYANVLIQNMGEIWGYGFLVIAIISQCAIFNAYLASGSRGFFVLADDNLCPKFLTNVSKKRGVPYVGILTLTAVTIVLAQYDFKTLVKTEVIFIMALYFILPPTIWKLRKKYPVEKRHKLFVITGGKLGLCLNTLIPLIMAIIIFFTNGTDNVLIGMFAAATGPVLYVIMKLVYGGCSKNNLAKYPLNPKTRLAKGDMFRMALFSLIAGIASLLGRIFLIWFESDFGETLFADGDGGLFSNYQQMLGALNYIGAAFLITSAVLFVLGSILEKSMRNLAK